VPQVPEHISRCPRGVGVYSTRIDGDYLVASQNCGVALSVRRTQRLAVRTYHVHITNVSTRTRSMRAERVRPHTSSSSSSSSSSTSSVVIRLSRTAHASSERHGHRPLEVRRGQTGRVPHRNVSETVGSLPIDCGC